MIRDPSDGSVREAPKQPVLDYAERAAIASQAAKQPDTGIRQPAMTDAQERLERSREWLKNYHAKRGVSHADGGNDGKERSASGDSSNDQGEGKS